MNQENETKITRRQAIATIGAIVTGLAIGGVAIQKGNDVEPVPTPGPDKILPSFTPAPRPIETQSQPMQQVNLDKYLNKVDYQLVGVTALVFLSVISLSIFMKKFKTSVSL